MERYYLLQTLHNLRVLTIKEVHKHTSGFGNPEGTNGLTWCGYFNGYNYYVSFEK